MRAVLLGLLIAATIGTGLTGGSARARTEWTPFAPTLEDTANGIKVTDCSAPDHC